MAKGRKPLFEAFEPTPTEAWEERIRRDLKGGDYEQTLLWNPEPGMRLRPYYRREDLDELPPTIPNARRETTVRATLNASSLAEANEQARVAIEGGARALCLNIRRHGTSWHGLPLFRPADAERLLEGIAIGEITIDLHITDADGRTARPLLALLLEAVDRQGGTPTHLSGAVCTDPWAAWTATGEFYLEHALGELALLLGSVDEAVPQLRVLGIDAQPYHEAGATASRELALTLAAISETLAQLTERDVDPVLACGHLHVLTPVGTSYFLEIAKLRALRHLIPLVTRTYLKDDANVRAVPLQAITSRRTMTRYDAHMNMVRGATAAAAAVIGGADIVEVRSFDEAEGTPSAFGERIARNTSLILHHESRMDHVVDPAAGSYYIETLTDKLAERAWRLFQAIEQDGGLLAGLRSGTIQRQINEDRHGLERALVTREQVLVGINHYPDSDERTASSDPVTVTPTTLPTSGVTLRQTTLAAFRNAFHGTASLGDLVAADRPDEPPFRIAKLNRSRVAEPFERLRMDTERFAEEKGAVPAIFLLPVGSPAIRSARANFARNVLGCAGFKMIEPLGFDSMEEGLEAVADAQPDIVVLCTSDGEIVGQAEALTAAVRDNKSSPLIVLAGRPAGHVERLREAGVFAFLHHGMDILAILQRLQDKLGVERSRVDA